MREARVARAMAYTNSIAASAPKKAAVGTAAGQWGRNAAHRTAKNPAPALTPMIFGPASGFASTDWMMTPDTASALPARMQASVLGRRT